MSRKNPLETNAVRIAAILPLLAVSLGVIVGEANATPADAPTAPAPTTAATPPAPPGSQSKAPVAAKQIKEVAATKPVKTTSVQDKHPL